jgi:hypothetical protein
LGDATIFSGNGAGLSEASVTIYIAQDVISLWDSSGDFLKEDITTEAANATQVWNDFIQAEYSVNDENSCRFVLGFFIIFPKIYYICHKFNLFIINL